MQATTVREALRASLSGTFGTVLSVLPRLVVFAIALAVGWAISSLLARGTIAVLKAVRFDEMAHRSGLARFIQLMGVQQDPASTVASVAKWLVRLMTLVVALDTLGLPAGSGVLHQLLLWLPNLAVGLVALVIGGLAATALSRLVQGAAAVAGLPNPQLLATGTSVAVWAFAIVVGVGQLGIATPVVNLGLVGVVGGLALAAGLAFGWASRERAAQLLSLLDGGQPSPSGLAGTASPSATTSFTPPAAADSSASPDTLPTSMASAAATAPSNSASPPDPAGATPPPEVADIASVPVIDTSRPDLGVPAPGLDASAPHLDGSAPELEAAAPDLDVSAPDLDVFAPDLDVSAHDLDMSPPDFDASAPALDASSPVLDGSAPVLVTPAPELALFPEDEPALGPAHVVPFEEGWIPRSGLDRRRIPRPGPDRRASVA